VNAVLDAWLTAAVPGGQPEPFAVSRWTVKDGRLGAAVADAGAKARQESVAAHTAASFTMTILSLLLEPDKVSASG
jgi:hypothetical protein